MDPAPWLRLTLTREIGPVLAHRLLDRFGSPETVFDSAGDVEGFGPARRAALFSSESLERARREIELAGTAGVRLITLGDDEYPPLLRHLPAPPLVLWVRGRVAPADALALAVVGPRRPSSYARLMTRKIATELAAKGLSIVSGLAYGVDAEAHQAALEAGGRTIGVVGHGLGVTLNPQSNEALAKRIVDEDRGALVSIFPMQTEAYPGNFPMRNEIVAGMSLGALVVEAAPTSGALITARHAAALDRPVMACPGDATRRAAQGANALIADGAALVQTADGALGALGPDLRHAMEDFGLESDEPNEPGAASPPSPNLGVAAAMALEILAEEPLPADALLARLGEAGHPRAIVLDQMLELEIIGKVQQMPGGIYALKG